MVSSSTEVNGSSSFSIDLVSEARRHVEFLRQLHSLGITIQPLSSPISSSSSSSSLESFRRYRDLWLPMVMMVENGEHRTETASCKRKKLVPPSDVAWLWHCHRLAPYRYKEYIRQTFSQGEGRNTSSGLFLSCEANPAFAFQHEKQEGDVELCGVETSSSCASSESNSGTADAMMVAKETRDLWKKLYPDEVFFLSLPNSNGFEKDKAMNEPNHHHRTDFSLCGFDLRGSMERQATFLWQVSGTKFHNEAFLREGVTRYQQFLQLKRIAPQQIIVPTYQIDLLWHTHMLSSIDKYDRDCRRIIGMSLHHDDSLNDRTEGGMLDVAFRATQKLWRETYREEYAVVGGMYRGEPPDAFFSREWTEKQVMDEMDDLPNGPLVGRVGASSTGAAPVSWLDATTTAKTPDGKPAVILESALSAKERKEDYVYGKGTLGRGYYHIYTRDAYAILAKRIESTIRQKKQSMNSLECCMTVCCQNTRENILLLERYGDEVHDLEETLEIIRIRMNAKAPTGIPDAIRDDPQKAERFNQYMGDGTGYWYMPDAYFLAGGGCGGTGFAGGGGCGGAGCGGAGCGGGGCGGGGCGGGCGG